MDDKRNRTSAFRRTFPVAGVIRPCDRGPKEKLYDELWGLPMIISCQGRKLFADFTSNFGTHIFAGACSVTAFVRH